MFYVYFIKSIRNQKIYVGFTAKNPKTRVEEHNQKSNKWTGQNTPFILLYYERYHCENDARAREIFYKSGFGRKIRDSIIRAVSAKGGPASGGG